MSTALPFRVVRRAPLVGTIIQTMRFTGRMISRRMLFRGVEVIGAPFLPTWEVSV